MFYNDVCSIVHMKNILTIIIHQKIKSYMNDEIYDVMCVINALYRMCFTDINVVVCDLIMFDGHSSMKLQLNIDFK